MTLFQYTSNGGDVFNIPEAKMVATRTIRTGAKTPVEMKNLGIINCVTVMDAISLLSILVYEREWRFFHNHQLFITKIPKKYLSVTSEQMEFDQEELILKLMQPVELFCNQMIDSNSRMLVVSEEIVRKAIKLVPLSVEVSMLLKYKDKLPSGRGQLAAADQLFEALCKELKVGRMTRALRNSKREPVSIEEVL